MKRIYKYVILLLCVSLLIGCSNKSSDYATESLDGTSSILGTGSKGESASDNTTEDSKEELTDNVATNRKLIKTVTLVMETKSLEDSKALVDEALTACGGYIESSRYDDMGSSAYGMSSKEYHLTIRVNSEKLPEFLTSIEGAGAIQTQIEDTEDVTLQYNDVETHKKTLLVEQERLLALLEQATDIDSIIKLEEKLSSIRYELESYESQLKLYDNLVEYSTVELTLSEVEKVTENPDSLGERISEGWKEMLYNLKVFFENAIVLVILNLPLLLFAIIVIFIVRAVLKKRKKKRAKKQTVAKESEIESKED